MTLSKKAEALFTRLAVYVIVFMSGLLIGTVISSWQFKSECPHFYAYHPDAVLDQVGVADPALLLDDEVWKDVAIALALEQAIEVTITLRTESLTVGSEDRFPRSLFTGYPRNEIFRCQTLSVLRWQFNCQLGTSALFERLIEQLQFVGNLFDHPIPSHIRMNGCAKFSE
jgi:hypothetical protein